MVDRFDRATRSRMMAAVGTANTAPELLLRQTLRALGVSGYRLHRRDLIGRPDLAWIGLKLAVFVDGAFWHGHGSAYKAGQSGEFWDRKIAANVARDRRVRAALARCGWKVIRVWDFEVEKNPDACARRVADALSSRRRMSGPRHDPA